MKDLRTDVLLVPGIAVQLLADLVNLEPLGRRTHVESHHWTRIMWPL